MLDAEKRDENRLDEDVGVELEVTDGVEEEVVQPDLPGLDIKEGKFRVKGTISASPIFRRKGPNTNIAKSSGYAIEEVATGRVMYMTKMEGVALSSRYGMQNAYIIKHERKKRDSNGDVIKKSESIYLQPYPARKESFTQDGRLISMFKLDENNKIEYPIELMLEEEKCTKDFWILVQQIYKQKKGRRNRSKSRERHIAEKRRQLIQEIEDEISKVKIDNPFGD